MQAIIEIPKNSYYKYELESNDLILDRVLSVDFPYNYGFIPKTLAKDGDPLDVFVLSEHPILPNAHVSIDILGIILCRDQGVEDHKIIARILGDTYPVFGWDQTITEFLLKYKTGFEILGVGDTWKALEAIYAALRTGTSI
jgi:inorganic pyrophosphatase